MSGQQPQYWLPTAPSASGAADDLAAWDTTVETSLHRAKSSAELWRNGLAGFVALLTTALVLRGPESAEDMGLFWRVWVGVGLVGGLGLSVWSLWLALSAASPTLKGVDYATTVRQWATIRAAQVAAAQKSADRLTFAKRVMVVALVLLGLGYGAWWLAPSSVETRILITREDGSSVCGELASGPAGAIWVGTNASADGVPLGSVSTVEKVANC